MYTTSGLFGICILGGEGEFRGTGTQNKKRITELFAEICR